MQQEDSFGQKIGLLSHVFMLYAPTLPEACEIFVVLVGMTSITNCRYGNDLEDNMIKYRTLQ